MYITVKIILVFISFNVFEGTLIIDKNFKLTDINGVADDMFGYCLSINNEYVVVGSFLDDENGKVNVGSISVYTINGNVLQLNTKITPSEGQAYDRFGTSVALNNNNYIVVGSYYNQGSAYVYYQVGNTWIHKKIVADDGAQSDYFGWSVDINDNNEVVVGAYLDDDKGSASGSVYVFSYDGNQWAQQQKLVPSDLSATNYFGYSVSITNTHIVVGAYYQTNNNVGNSGGVYIYTKSNNNAWNNQVKLTSPNPQTNGYFGISVSIDGDRVVIGAYGEDTSKGNVYVYILDGNTWEHQQTLKASDKKNGDRFGYSVSIHKHTMVIGAAYSDDKGSDSGSSYAFEFFNGRWTEVGKMLAADGQANDLFGIAVSIFNGKVVVGVPHNDAKGANSGAAYLFNNLNFSHISTTPQTTTHRTFNSNNFTIICHELYVIGIWKKEQFSDTHNLTITLTDPVCKGFHQNRTHLWVISNFTQCGSTIVENGLTITQQNTARVTVTRFTSNIIQRKSFYNYNMKCTFDRVKNISTANSYNTTDRFIGTIDQSSTSDFNLIIAIYTNTLFFDVAPNYFTVTSFQPIYIGISETHNNKLFKFIVHQCFATPTSDIRGSHYTFFYRKCRVDPSFAIIHSNNNHFNFVIDAFTFIELSKSVYIHCYIYICTNNATSQDCRQECDNRKRREVSNEAPVRELTLTTQQITFQKQITCEELLCPSHSSCINIYPAICRCAEGYVFNPTTKLCINEQLFYIEGLYIDMKFEKPYLDPTSTIFINFANNIEKQLNYYIFQLGDGNIEGVQVIRLREGSVIVDLAVIYAKDSNKEDAYETFLKSIDSNYTQTFTYDNKLKIKTNIIPTIRDGPAENYTLIIIIVVISLVVAIIAIFILAIKTKCCRFQKDEKSIQGVINDGVSMEDIK